MDSFNQQFIYSISIILLGYLLKRFDIIREREGEGLTRIVLNVTLPCLIIFSFSDMKIDLSLILLPLIAILYGLLVTSIGLFVFKAEQAHVKGMLLMMIPGFNIGLFAFPLIEGIWGLEGLKYFGMYDAGNAMINFGLCYIIAAYFSQGDVQPDWRQIAKKITRSIPLVTYLIACLIAIIGWKLPSTVLEVSGIISQANMPLCLLLLGIYLNFRFDKRNIQLITKFLSIRYFFGLVIGLSLFWLLPVDDMFRYTLLVSFILPTSTASIAYSVEFGYDTKFVGTISNLTMIISFILVWITANLLL
ncbi:AEC family transporter [Radiobacillus sp. PE A8.2]|uniref:AEC family transporter n=1 Tax=Radiobacillus sp. PE A8.2 TaxID=3380349 RepID=UPI003890104D